MKATSDIEALQAHSKCVLQGEDKMIGDIQEILTHAMIKRDYKQEIQDRYGESKTIMLELSLKYYNTPYKTDVIHDVIYRKYR